MRMTVVSYPLEIGKCLVHKAKVFDLGIAVGSCFCLLTCILLDSVLLYMMQAKLYEDSERWGFAFNLYAALTRLQMHSTVTVSVCHF